MKIIVCQYGSRHRYLIPQILFKKGMLSALYTDATKNSLLGKLSHILNKIGISSPTVSRLLNRDPKIPDRYVMSSDRWALKILYNAISNQSDEIIHDTFSQGGSKTFIKSGLKDCDWVYTMFFENIEFLLYAKSHGKKIIADIFENPYVFEDLVSEIDRNPEYQCVSNLKAHFQEQVKFRKKYVDTILAVADKYLVPSQFVAQQLKRSPNFNAEKVNIVPYGSSINRMPYCNSPQIGRMIWVGNDMVRKGLIYAIKAVMELRKKFPFCSLRVIGDIPPEFIRANQYDGIEYIGHLNKEDLSTEFKLADAYIFPTLSEGLAGTVIEAASFGVPIITTSASGLDNDFPGISIPLRDTISIVNACSLIITDRNYRTKISHDIYHYSQNFDENSFERNLIKIFEE